MATQTDEEKLAALDEAIQNVLVGGQTRTVRGRSVTYAPLSELQKQRNILAAQINSRLPKATYFRRRRG